LIIKYAAIPNIIKYILRVANTMGHIYLTYSSMSQKVIPAKNPIPQMKLYSTVIFKLEPFITNRKGTSANHIKNPRSIKLKKSSIAERMDRMIFWYVFIGIPLYLFYLRYTQTSASAFFKAAARNWNYTRIKISNE